MQRWTLCGSGSSGCCRANRGRESEADWRLSVSWTVPGAGRAVAPIGSFARDGWLFSGRLAPKSDHWFCTGLCNYSRSPVRLGRMSPRVMPKSFLGGLKTGNTACCEPRPSKAAETLQFLPSWTVGRPMPVDRGRRIAGGQRYRQAPILRRLRRVDGVEAQQQVAGPHLRSLHDLLDLEVLVVMVDPAPASSNLWEGSLFSVPQMPQVPQGKNAPSRAGFRPTACQRAARVPQ